MTKAVGQPPEAVEEARQTPMWPALEALAHTLAYDAHVMGGDTSPLPETLLANLPTPVLAVYSTGSPGWLVAGATAVAAAALNGESAGLDGGFHEVPADTLSPALREFYQRVR
jgi:hypothetical protein